MGKKQFRHLLETLDKNHPVIIQTHDYPDHDAVAAGFALSYLLTSFGFQCTLVYGGEMQGDSIDETIEMLGIPAVPAAALKIDDRSQVILVDGFAGNKNVTELSGTLVGIIDHHKPPEPPSCPFADIRPDVGSCATIVYQYFLETGTEAPRDVATSLLMGIMMDTAYMTRGVGPIDLAAFSGIFFKSDWEKASYVLRNSLSVRDLPLIRHAMDNNHILGDVCFVELEKSCRAELLGLLSDYFLSFKEIFFVVTYEIDETQCRISVRSEDPRRPADKILRRALEGYGYGGGHMHMSGGFIPADAFPGGPWLRERFLSVLGETTQ